MKTFLMATCAAALALALPAFAQDVTDHFNNQSSIVPDTVPDKVSHTDHGQIKADRMQIQQDRAEIEAHEAHEQAQMSKHQKDDHLAPTPGQTPPIATQ